MDTDTDAGRVEAPRLRSFSYRFDHPAYGWDVRLDCPAPDREHALAKARRHLARENRRRRKDGLRPLRLPSHVGHLTEEAPACSA